ncbi:MAG: response regulator [Epulopiscium sp.]|nr:response regulator [Candidatus Epulonipiscium sp.]
MLKILIAEDDLASRQFLKKFLSKYGECDIVVDGLEAIDAYMLAMREKKPYDLICLDIMMPKIDGVKVLKAIRDMEAQNFILPEKRVKIIMITALAEAELVQTAFQYGCEAYASKPIDIDKFVEVMEKLELIPKKESKE